MISKFLEKINSGDDLTPWQKAQNVVDFFMNRIAAIVKEFHVDIAEVFAFVSAASWFIPLTLYNDFMSRTVFMRAVLAYLPEQHVQATFGLLMAAHLFSLIVIGNPARLTKKREYMIFWYRCRQVVMFTAAFIWWGMAVITSTGIVTQGFILYTFVGVGCMYAVWLFQLAITVISVQEQREKVKIEAHLLYKSLVHGMRDPDGEDGHLILSDASIDQRLDDLNEMRTISR